MYRCITRALILTLALGIGGPVASQSDTVHTKRYDDGGVYKGTFRYGQQHGTGTYTLPNGYEYTGEWVNGEIRGQGVARFPNGSVYEGEFAKGKPNGIGKIVFTDGGTYEGGWVDGKITGTGIALYANGARYEGGFLDDMHHGRGRIQYPGGAIYDGEWAKGVVEGEGKLTYTDGAVYHGLFSQGERNGQGTLTMSDGMVYAGLWSDGEITSLDTPDFRRIIDRLDYIGAVDKAATTELLQTAFTLIGGMEPDGTAALLGVSAEEFAAEFLLDPESMLAAVGSDIAVGAGKVAFAEATGDLVEGYMFKSGPLSELPNEWQVPLRAFVDATIVESVGLLSTGTDPTGASLVGPIVDRLKDVHEIYQATNALSQAQAVGLFAVANGAELIAELVREHPSKKAEILKTDWFAATRENLPDIVGADDAGSAYKVTVLGFNALDALGRGEVETAKSEIEKMLALGDAEQGLTPLSAEGPIDLLVRLASGGNDSPKVLVETFLKSTSLSSLQPDSNDARSQSATAKFIGAGVNNNSLDSIQRDVRHYDRWSYIIDALSSGFKGELNFVRSIAGANFDVFDQKRFRNELVDSLKEEAASQSALSSKIEFIFGDMPINFGNYIFEYNELALSRISSFSISGDERLFHHAYPHRLLFKMSIQYDKSIAYATYRNTCSAVKTHAIKSYEQSLGAHVTTSGFECFIFRDIRPDVAENIKDMSEAGRLSISFKCDDIKYQLGHYNKYLDDLICSARSYKIFDNKSGQILLSMPRQ